MVESAARTVEAELHRLRAELQRVEGKYAQEQQQRRAQHAELSAARDTQHELEAERAALQRSLADAQARCAATASERVRTPLCCCAVTLRLCWGTERVKHDCPIPELCTSTSNHRAQVHRVCELELIITFVCGGSIACLRPPCCEFVQDTGAERLQAAQREAEELKREVEAVRGRCEAAEAQRDKLKAATAALEAARREVAEELKDIKEAHTEAVGHLQDALQTKQLREQVLQQQHAAAVGSLEAQVTSVTERANIYQVRGSRGASTGNCLSNRRRLFCLCLRGELG